jgi:hypothetical protein
MLFIYVYICRFRLELQVKDPTASTIFVLFDDVAEQVVQVKLGDLASNLEKRYLVVGLIYERQIDISMYTWFTNNVNQSTHLIITNY